VPLADGSLGLLPDAWVERVMRLVDLGDATGPGVRFHSHQALLLDAALGAEPDTSRDAVFRRVCRRLGRARAPRARPAPRGFRGRLRPYQREGLGWLHHLREIGLGGCLADDMGLGKTVQILALLAAVRATRRRSAEPLPSLIVMPRSLIHSWAAEAERFTPGLRVIDYTGLGRGSLRERLGEFDVVLTTYGTLRRDIAKLEQLRFEHVVLDEATAIKNAASQTWKAARRIRAEHRLALTGTPVENHLGELWALFEFLNPGMLGSTARSQRRLQDDEAHMHAVRRALEPFLLRRTKQQVLPQLPPKTEQTLHCELQGAQRRQYDELLRHYRSRLRERIQTHGMARSHMHVLEALLRLRQAACHPGLIDARRRDAPAAKLDVLFPALEQALDEGHKLLVFSQFTTFLAIVRARLEGLGIPHAYLDGRTHRRAECVRRFQEDPECRVFLISLKAGGHGLNLTAADYVFLLDPWWNPAVESQAIDRAHRIGQDRPVVAYRVVARDTIEEKILALHDTKRSLADAILSSNRRLLRQLTPQDLEVLLA
jgi:SNF2 family DNA or RNA helicase